MALVSVGWLTYALARALWAAIHLDVPWFDWQWYLCAIAFLVGLAVCVVTGLPRSKVGRGTLVALLLWMVVGYDGLGQDLALRLASSPWVPISFWTGSETSQAPVALLDELRCARGRLYLSIGKQQFTGENRDALVDGLRRLARHDIEVYLAVRASDYLSVPVHDEWVNNVLEVAGIVRDERLANVRGILGDAEPPKHGSLDVLGVDREAFASAVRDLENLIQSMGEEYPSLDLGVTASWILYLDSIDGDADLSIVARSSVDPPGGWDSINVMTYSSYLPSSWRAYYVYLVERAMARLHPDLQPSHLIGLAIRGNPGEPELDFDDLVRDARLSRAMGVREIVVYKLNDRALEVFGDDFVHRLSVAANDVRPDSTVEVPFSRPASVLVCGAMIVDALLDIRGWKGLAFVVWAVLSGLLARRSA